MKTFIIAINTTVFQEIWAKDKLSAKAKAVDNLVRGKVAYYDYRITGMLVERKEEEGYKYRRAANVFSQLSEEDQKKIRRSL